MCNKLHQFERKPESHYQVTKYVSEFYNTLTNIPFVIVGLYNLLHLMTSSARYDSLDTLVNLYWLMIAAGIASGIHHAFIFKGSIILDWIPIAVSILILLFNPCLLELVTLVSWCKVAIALGLLISDHVCTPLKVPLGHCLWHLAACWSVNAMYSDMLKYSRYEPISALF